MQFIGWKNGVTKGVIIVHLEETEDLENYELEKIGFTQTQTLGNWDIGRKENLTYTRFDPSKFLRGQQYTVYLGTSTSGNCELSLIIHCQHSEFISKAQLKNMGGSELQPMFEAKEPFSNLTIMQNFVGIDHPQSDPLSGVLSKGDMLAPAFPVAIQFYNIMYYPPDVTYLGEIPKDATPFWKELPESDQRVSPTVLPETPDGYKLQLYYHVKNNDGLWTPKYIVVPKYFVPNAGVRPHKIPIAIRSKESYPNFSKGVVNIDMVVLYSPEAPIPVPQPPKPPKLPAPYQMTDYVLVCNSSGGSPANNSKNNETGRVLTNITRVCKRYRFEVVLNVRGKMFDILKDLPDGLIALLNECLEWEYTNQVIPININNDTNGTNGTGNCYWVKKNGTDNGGGGDDGKKNETKRSHLLP